MIFSLAWNTIFTDNLKVFVLKLSGYWKGLVLNLSVMENTVFLSLEVDGKMIFTCYWEVLVLNLLVMGNTVFLSAKRLMERWYVHGLFELSMIFQDLGNMFFSRSAGNEQSIFVHELLKTVFIWFTMVNELGTLMYFLSFSCPD